MTSPRIWPVDWVSFLKEIRRQPAWVVGLTTVGLVGALVALRLVTPVYWAGTSILVEPQRIPSDYVKPTVTLDLRDRLATIQQQITRRENLVRVVTDLDLYPELLAEGRLDEAYARARSSLGVNVQKNQFFEIVFGHTDPEKAADAANRIAELFLEENLAIREQQAATTTDFLESELEQTRMRLEEQERRIDEFKRANLGGLPEQQNTLLRSIETAQAKLEINLAAADRAESRRLSLQRALAEVTASPTAAFPMAGATMDERALTISDLRGRLTTLLAEYTERHPEVIRTRRLIEQLEANAPAETPADGTNQTPARASGESILQGQLVQQITDVELELSTLADERARILAEIEEDSARLRQMPQVETRLLDLTRDYDNLRNSYESMLGKKLEAELAENLERRKQGEQFRILEHATAPAKPSWPKPSIFLLAGLGLGAGAGLGLSLLRFQLQQAFVDRDDFVAHAPGVEILGTIPPLADEGELRRAAG